MAEVLSSTLMKGNVLVCVGPGGVGKTTMAASLGFLSAQAGLKTLVLTVDPSRRLAREFGLADSEEQKQIKNSTFQFPEGGEFWVGAIHHEKFFSRFISEGVKDQEVVDQLKRNKIYQRLNDTLAGAQDFTSMGRLSEVYQSGEFDLIVLDTPPSEHAMDFFIAHKKFRRLFDAKIMSWFSKLNEGDDHRSSRIFKSIVGFGLQSAQSILRKLTGSYFLQELTDFFSALSRWQKELMDRTDVVENLLKSSSVKFIGVTSAEDNRLFQVETLNQQLKEQNLCLDMVIINRLFQIPDRESLEIWPELQKYVSYQKNKLRELQESVAPVSILTIPEMAKDMGSLEGICFFAESLKKQGG